MEDLLLNPRTKVFARRVVEHPPHAIALDGPRGSGKAELARLLAGQILGVDVNIYPYFKIIKPINNSISIDSVRELQSFLHLRTIGKKKLRRAIIIEDAGTMTHEAQNAILKTLEEPPADTILVLTVSRTSSLIPTVASRVTELRVLPVGLDDTVKFFKERGFSEQVIAKAWSLARGHAGLISGLLESGSDHELLGHIDRAKDLFKMSVFERLSQVDALSKDKAAIEPLLMAFDRITRSGLEQSALNHADEQTKRWHRIASALQDSQAAHNRNANSKLLLTELMLNLS